MSASAKLYVGGVLKADVTPIFNEKLSVDVERAEGEMYRRTKLNSTFRFTGKDYDLIYWSYLDEEFEIRVYNDGYEVAKGTFCKSDCEFDAENKICTVKANSADVYDKLLAGINDEYDLIRLAPVREKLYMTKRAVLQLYVLHDTKITNIIGNMSYEVDLASDINSDDLTPTILQNTYNFSQLRLGQDAIIVSKMPSGYEHLVGTYTGTYLEQASTYSQQGGYNKIVVGSLVDEYGRTRYYWYFKDRNGNAIQIRNNVGDMVTITTKSWYEIFPPYHDNTTLVFGYEMYNSYYEKVIWGEDPRMSTSYKSESFFGRILLDTEPEHPVGDVKEITSQDICSTNLNYRFSMKVTDLTELPNLIIFSAAVQDEPTRWGVNGDGKYYIQPNPIDVYDNVIPIGWNRWIPNSFWLNSTIDLANKIDSFNASWTLNDAFPLWSVIDVLLKKIDPTITFKGTEEYSQFLYGTIPSSVIYDWRKQLLYITPITNVKKTYYNMAARKAKIRLKDVLNMLKSTCQLYWFIDSQKRLRIEHITWFRNGGNYSQQTPLFDLTSVISPMSKKTWSFGQDIYDYDKASLAKRYEFGWNEETSEAFDGFSIDINNAIAKNGSTEKAQVTNFISDIDLIISSPDRLGDDTFALIGVDEDKKCPIAIIRRSGQDFIAPMYKMQNPFLSFYFLEIAYWFYNLSGDDATTTEYRRSDNSDGILYVYSTKRAKTQKVKFPINNAYVGKEGLIKTDIGSGEWVNSSFTPDDGMVQMELNMDTMENPLLILQKFNKKDNSLMKCTIKNGEHKARIIFDGCKTTFADWGYIRFNSNKTLKVTITASSRSGYDFGWFNGSYITNPLEAEQAERHVSGTESVTFTHQAGVARYIGYAKDMIETGGSDKIIFDFEEI